MEENEFEFGFTKEEFEVWFQCLIGRCMSEEEVDVLYETKEELAVNWNKILSKEIV